MANLFKGGGIPEGLQPLVLVDQVAPDPLLEVWSRKAPGKSLSIFFAFQYKYDSPLLHPLLLRETFLQCEQLLVRLLPQVVEGEGQGGGGEPLHPGQAVPGEPQSVGHAL